MGNSEKSASDEDASDGKSKAVMVAWKSYDIVDCLRNVVKAISDLSEELLNSCWKKLWPECVKSAANTLEKANEIQQGIISLGKKIGGEGFSDLDQEDIDDVLLIDELTEEELLELCGERYEKESVDIEPEKKEDQMKQNVLAGILADAERLMQNISIHDPIEHRSSLVCLQIRSAVAPYDEIQRQIYNKKNQKKMSDFFATSTVPAESSSSEEELYEI